MMNRNQILVITIIISFILIPYSHFTNLQANPLDAPSFPLSSNHEVIINAINFLKNQQDSDGSIGGLSISPWVSMAFASVNEKSESFHQLTSYLISSIDKLNKTEKATDWQRHILGIITSNSSLVQTKKNYYTQKIISFYNNNQIGEEQNIYDDCFGIFALSSLTNNSINQTIQKNLKQNILKDQQINGGWGDVDTTAMCIMALRILGLSSDNTSIINAYSFLRNFLDESGGFISWGSANTASTSWAISALSTLNTSMKELIWNESQSNPLTYLLKMQQEDGSFNYSNSSKLNPIWMTSYAIIALRGKSFPVTILFSQNHSNDNLDDKQNDNNTDDSNEPVYPNIQTSNQPYFYLQHPNINGLYINSKFIQLSIQKPIIVGPITFEVKTNASIDMVVFFTDDISYIDTSYPYKWDFQPHSLCQQLSLKVYGISLQKNITKNQLNDWIQLLLNSQEDGENNRSMLNYFIMRKNFDNWLLPSQYVDTLSCWVIKTI